MTSPLWWDSGLVFLAHRFQLQCGIPKASGKRSFQHSHSNHWMTLFLSSSPLFNWSFFSPMLLLDSGLGRCPTLVGPFCEGTRSRGKMMRWWWWWWGGERKAYKKLTHSYLQPTVPPILLSTTAPQLCSPSKTSPLTSHRRKILPMSGRLEGSN